MLPVNRAIQERFLSEVDPISVWIARRWVIDSGGCDQDPDVIFRNRRSSFRCRIFFNSGGLGPADLEFNLNNSGGTTEYRVAPFGLGVVNNTGFLLTGFLVELGFGVGLNFVRSGAADGLDFDTPDHDPAPSSVAFPTLVQDVDTLRWSGAVVGLGQIGASFAIDVPDGLQNFHPSGVNRFTVRLTPVAIPEPSSAVLLLAGLSVVALCLRRPSR